MGEHIRHMLAGPGTLRFVVQPAVAVALGIWHGLRDRRLEHAPYLASLLSSAGRSDRLRHGLKALALPLFVALSASLIFQYIVRAQVRPSFAIVYAATFVALPYLAARSLTNRIAQARRRRRSSVGPAQPVS